ncbi:MAG TPA: TetR/AcrR family transcriptional regulator [Thermoanaerobaculia bacterium]|nr:TetR/AcrR family transcriptional regulator [Thermoanaerobaculia bacterium]
MILASGPRSGRAASSRPPSLHVQKKRDAKRLQILESAVRAFAARGFHGTSMEEIAGELRLTRGSLYYYFRDKEEILALCHAVALEAVLAAFEKVRASAMPPDEKLRRLILQHVKIQVDKFHGTALALELDALRPASRSAVVAGRDRYDRGLRELIEEGIRARLFRPVDTKLAAFAVVGAINWIGRWYRPEGGATPDELGSEFADLFLAALSDSKPEKRRRR